MNLISNAIERLSSWLNGFQVKRFLAVALVGFLVLATQVDTGRQAFSEQYQGRMDDLDSVRPKTTGQWNKEARETAHNPDDRLERIKDQSGKALKEFGEMYSDTAKRTASEFKENTAHSGQQF